MPAVNHFWNDFRRSSIVIYWKLFFFLVFFFLVLADLDDFADLPEVTTLAFLEHFDLPAQQVEQDFFFTVPESVFFWIFACFC